MMASPSYRCRSIRYTGSISTPDSDGVLFPNYELITDIARASSPFRSPLVNLALSSSTPISPSSPQQILSPEGEILHPESYSYTLSSSLLGSSSSHRKLLQYRALVPLLLDIQSLSREPPLVHSRLPNLVFTSIMSASDFLWLAKE